MGSARHWHGFAPWTGPTETLKREESARRPGREPGDIATQAFLSSTLPPLQLGHYLLRRREASAGRTWTTAEEAVRWLADTYNRHPPVERQDGQAWVALDARKRHSCDGLIHGSDALWHYETRGGTTVVYAVICCPHSHMPQIPCPCPPS